jgi:uncharacterized protein
LTVLYVVSRDAAAGKTTICAGIGKYLQSTGKKIGFLKLVADENDRANGDAVFMKQILNLAETEQSLCLSMGDLKSLKEACANFTPAKDIVVVEGKLGQNADDSLTKTSFETAKALAARVIIVEPYHGQPFEFADSYKGFEANLLGIVLNKVPVSKREHVQYEASKQFGAAKIKVLGVLPEERDLLAITVGELAVAVDGKILNNDEKSSELVENFMIGGMPIDSSLEYFARKSHKAVIIRNHRPDMQLVALETSTTCLVLSGSRKSPINNVLVKAKNRRIPIVTTESATLDIVGRVEEALLKSRFNQEKKLQKLIEILKQYFDLDAL